MYILLWALLTTDWSKFSGPTVPQALVSAKHFTRLICVMQQLTEHSSSSSLVDSSFLSGELDTLKWSITIRMIKIA